MSNKKLFNDFQEVSAKAWKQQIQFDLKGADYNETLVWESPEGIKVKPFYNVEDINKASASLHSGKGTWKIGHSVYADNAIMANEKAIDLLSKGVEGLQFIIPSETVKIEVLLKDIDLANVTVYLELQFLSDGYIKSIRDFVGDAIGNIHMNIDLIGNLGSTGNWFFNLDKDHKVLDSILNANNQNVISVDVSLYQNAGANIVQQLSYALAHANEYLNHFYGNKTVTGKSSFSICFKVSVGTNYFFEIAKLRALRILFKTLAAEYDSHIDCHIIAMPTRRNKTLYDYNVNMLRTTTECMAAVLGGADTVFNLPYDAIYHKNNDFGERIAINQLLLLKNESYFDKIGNPADGSYYVESITDELAQKALLLFKTIEKGGGFLKQLKSHTIQKKIKESAQKEQEKFNAKEEVLVGTNKFVNDMDKMKNDIEIHPFVKMNPRKTLIPPIIAQRLAEKMEQKRLDDE